MESTIKVSINVVYMGYEHKGSINYKKEFGYYVYPKLNGSSTFVWREKYEELREYVEKYYGILLPPERKLHFFNYGAPHNVAEV